MILITDLEKYYKTIFSTKIIVTYDAMMTCKKIKNSDSRKLVNFLYLKIF